MKNPTILKDELGLLRADRSAVLTELRKISEELKDIYILKSVTLSELEDVRNTIQEETARLDDLRGRAVSVKAELTKYTQELMNIKNSWETARVKNSQEMKLHLGRIKELKENEIELLDKVSVLKKTYDNNSSVYLQHEMERRAKLRSIDSEIQDKEVYEKELSTKLDKDITEDKRLTKERLKKEDKLRVRERNLGAKEKSVNKKEEDLITMSNDIVIVYGRLKELYAKIDAGVDLDKLIMQAV